MPLYEYRCQSCGRRFEVLQQVGADHKGLSCPECGKQELQKEVSTFSGTSTGSASGACSTSRFT